MAEREGKKERSRKRRIEKAIYTIMKIDALNKNAARRPSEDGESESGGEAVGRTRDPDPPPKAPRRTSLIRIRPSSKTRRYFY